MLRCKGAFIRLVPLISGLLLHSFQKKLRALLPSTTCVKPSIAVAFGDQWLHLHLVQGFLVSCVQVGKRFQQPQAGHAAHYERGSYMLDRLGLSVSLLAKVNCSSQHCVPEALLLHTYTASYKRPTYKASSTPIPSLIHYIIWKVPCIS